MSLEEAKSIYESGDIESAVRLLEAVEDSDAALEVCHDMMMSAYWESKDLAGAIVLGQCAIERCRREADANRNNDPARAATLLKRASIFSYNLSSFCWRGWDEPGIAIGNGEEALGAEMAEQHRQWVEELDLDDIKKSRAWWLIGAFALVRGRWNNARRAFEASIRFAESAQDVCETLLVQGYAALVEHHQRPDDVDAAARLARIKSRLAELDDGSTFIAQLDTAAKVVTVSNGTDNTPSPA